MTCAQAAPSNSAIQASTQLLATSRSPASVPTKAELVEALRQTQARQLQVLTNIDSQTKSLLQESTELSLKGRDLAVAKMKLKKLADSLDALRNKREEFTLRREFIDQLILVVDTKWNGQPIQEFLSGQLLEMAITDLSSRDTGPRSATFLIYLSVALRELPERRESTIAFIENYLNFATVLEPKSPVDFISSRSYSDGSVSVSAHEIDRKDLGDFVDKRLRELGLEKTEQSSKRASMDRAAALKQTLQIRMKAPSPSVDEPAPEKSENADQNPNSAVRNSSM